MSFCFLTSAVRRPVSMTTVGNIMKWVVYDADSHYRLQKRNAIAADKGGLLVQQSDPVNYTEMRWDGTTRRSTQMTMITTTVPVTTVRHHADRRRGS